MTANKIFAESIETWLFIMPFTYYWAMALAFYLTTRVHNSSQSEPLEEVEGVAVTYSVFAAVTSVAQLSLHGKLWDWLADEKEKSSASL